MYELYEGKKEEHFYVYFRGTGNGRYVRAFNLHSAKWIFALEHGLNSIGYVAGKLK